MQSRVLSAHAMRKHAMEVLCDDAEQASFGARNVLQASASAGVQASASTGMLEAQEGVSGAGQGLGRSGNVSVESKLNASLLQFVAEVKLLGFHIYNI